MLAWLVFVVVFSAVALLGLGVRWWMIRRRQRRIKIILTGLIKRDVQ